MVAGRLQVRSFQLAVLLAGYYQWHHRALSNSYGQYSVLQE